MDNQEQEQAPEPQDGTLNGEPLADMPEEEATADTEGMGDAPAEEATGEE